MKLSLRHHILLAVTPLLLLLMCLGGAGATLLVHLGRRSDAILRENYDSVRAMAGLNEALERIDSSYQFALAGQERDARAMHRANWVRYREQLGVEERNITIFPDEPRLVADLQNLTIRYQAQGEAFFARPAGDGRRREDYFGAKGLLHTFAEIKRVATAIHDLNEREMQDASRKAQDTARMSVNGFAIGLGVSVVLAVTAVLWLQRTILEPIQAVTEAATAIGTGQLHLVVPVRGQEEVGRLAEAFNAMTEKLRGYRQSNTERLLHARLTAQATIDSFPDPVVVIDLFGRVEFANPAAQSLLGLRPPLDGEPLAVWHPPESLRQPVEDALCQQRPVLTKAFDEAATFRVDGEDRTYLPQVRPTRSPEGEILGAAVVLNDVTRFRLLDRLKSDWVATVSHELKTPLTSVRLAVHVLLEEVVGPLEPKQVELLVEARENTERLLKLIEQLLALAKLEEGEEHISFRRADPADLLRAAADNAMSRAEDKRIAIVIDVTPGLPPVAVDLVRLGRALNNLLDNAITYTDAGGKVTLSARPADDGRVRLTVSDTGIGIPAESIPHVFDRFFRVPCRDHTPGTGLGLAIVREIVTAHHGDIVCESAPGRGTTFHITLPPWKEGT